MSHLPSRLPRPPAAGRVARFEFDISATARSPTSPAGTSNHANLFDRVEAKTGKQPFDGLVADVMTVEPYCSARTVYWIVVRPRSLEALTCSAFPEAL